MKPNAFTKLYTHYVFTPARRECLLIEPLMEKVQKYIYGIISEKKCYPIAINGMPDHLHLLIGLNPGVSVADLIRDIKRSSAIFINDSGFLLYKFHWQEGYGAFTVGYRELDSVYKYLLNQKEHHARQNFRDEYKEMLKTVGFDPDERFLFEFFI